MIKKRVKITSVGYRENTACFVGVVNDSLEERRGHELEILIADEDLSIEKIIQRFTDKEKKRLKDPDRPRRLGLAKEYLGREFHIEIDDQSVTSSMIKEET